MRRFAALGPRAGAMWAGGLLLEGRLRLSPPVRVHQVLTALQSDPLALASDAIAVAVLAAYLVLARQVGQRGPKWSRWRTASFASGLAIVFVAVGSGVASYEDTSFAMHVVQHLLLVTVAPVLLALGSPLTLALRASREQLRSRISKALHSGFVELISFPVFAAVLAYVTTAVYFLTPIYGISEKFAYLHGLLQLAFLVIGCIYWWPVVGPATTRQPMSYPARLAYLASGIPINSLIGVDLTLNHASIDRALYTVADTHTGGALLWGASVLAMLAGIAVMYWQWARIDALEAASGDRRLTGELAKDPRRDLAGGIIMDPRTGLWHYPSDEAPPGRGQPES